MALLAEEADECTGCGQPLTQTTDPVNRGAYEVDRATCEACVVLEANVDNDHESKRPRGVRYRVRRDDEGVA
jgi:hypothetical protein